MLCQNVLFVCLFVFFFLGRAGLFFEYSLLQLGLISIGYLNLVLEYFMIFGVRVFV